MEVVISIAAKIAEYTVAPISRQAGYLVFYKRYVDELRQEIQNLINASAWLQRLVDDAERNGEKIEAGVEHWLAQVTPFIEEAQKLFEDEEDAKRGAVAFRNLMWRRRLGRRAKKIALSSAILMKRVMEFNRVSYIPHSRTEITEYVAFDTRLQILREIMEELTDRNVRTVGVWGMPGVGKTMLAKEVARLAHERNLFHEVIFITVSHTPNIARIQQTIGESLGINLDGDSVSERAYQLRQQLRKGNKLLLVLDDVWDKLDLEEVGISFGDDQQRSKILVTSRSYDVLYNNMGIDKNFHVGVLAENEATSLFSNIVGDQARRPDFQPLATQIVKLCGGLPREIETVAHILENRSIDYWEDAIQKLYVPGMNEEAVFSSVKLGYDLLKSEEAKSLFLLCSLFNQDEDLSVEELCNYGIGLNLFQGINNLEDARQKTSMLVEILKAQSLLLDSEQGDNFVRMHDVIRDVVISIASEDKQMYSIGNADELKKYLHQEKFKGSTAISLTNINGDQFPETFECPVLKLVRLIRRNIEHSLQIPDGFLKGSKWLKVLDLEGVHLEPLPSSFGLLHNLQTLRLIKCTLGDIKAVGELKNLRILNLSYSSIEEFPREIGQLRRLQYLNLRSCRHLKVIQPNAISGLICLEELNLEQSFTNWEVEGARNANLSEVRDLPYLTILSLNVLDINILPTDMFSENLEKYKIIVGTEAPSDLVENYSSRLLMLKLFPNSRLNEHNFEGLLKRSEYLHLIGLKSVKNVAHELDSKGFRRLKHLRLEDSIEIRCIVNSIGNILSHDPALPILETLHLEGLMNLEKITHGYLLVQSFGNLRDVTVKNCSKLKSLFSLYIFRKLERITVEDCTMMEEIISHGKEGEVLDDNLEPTKMIMTSELLSLRLENLPLLVQLYSEFKTYTYEKSDKQSIDDSAMPFFNVEVEFPKLESLELDSLINVQRIWDQLPRSFGGQSLKKLTVMGCDNLNGLIPSSLSLGNLQSLCVERCKAMKEVVFTEESREGSNTSEKMLFPRLEHIELRYLPNLERFCAGDYDCPSLLKLEIRECPKLQITFISKVTFILS